MPQPLEIPKVLTTAETARHLRCGTKTVLRLIHEGKLHAVKPGAFWLVYADSVARYLGASIRKTAASKAEALETEAAMARLGWN